MGDLPGSGGAAAELNVLLASVGPSLSENWAAADKVCREIIRKVQPSHVSEERRRAVVHYIQRLIRNSLGAEVFPYGSVPLKTYLPDGDIDLTVFSGKNHENTLANDMQCVLEEEERNPAAEFVVKDVQLILAEVKIVKCIVEDIVVDISFNQIGGLCTLCFLEQVDRMIGKNHLFKQSIILIKAWCYYESRVLGAHHGLISTYALETLVLYIFHLYHSTLDGPLDVLYKFLDYFSKFSWETYCISLDGPIRVLSLPTVIADLPEDSDRDLLISRDFLNACVGVFTVPCRDVESSRGFQIKHMNIIDPLKEINNLGRSVSRGNYYRIRSAFLYGAKKLAQILVEPQRSITKELHKFFSNTMARHGGGLRPDVRHNFDEYFDEHAISRGDFQSGLGARFSGESDDLTTSGLDGLKLSTDSDKLDKSEKNECQLVDKDEAVASSKTRDVFRVQKSIRLSADLRHVDAYTAESLNSLDLAGDYASHLQCLQYGRWCFEFGFGMHPFAMPPFASPSYHWDGILPPVHYEPNGFHPNQALYAVPPVLYPYGWEELPKPRGTGMYFPNMNVPFHSYQQPSMKGRNQITMRSPRNNGRNFSRTEPNHQVTFSPHQNGNHSANGQFIPPKGVAEFEEIDRPQNPVSSSPRTFSGTRKSQTASRKEQNRILLTSSYQLKDEGDFPPLSV